MNCAKKLRKFVELCQSYAQNTSGPIFSRHGVVLPLMAPLTQGGGGVVVSSIPMWCQKVNACL